MEVLSLVFILSSVVIILTPGQDMMLVMSRSIVQGQKAGVITALGVSLGLMGHTLLATFGLGALLIASDWLFNIIKYVGAGYLVYLGYLLLRSQNKTLGTKELQTVSQKKMFMQGVVSNIMNPKITIFYFAYLPQFVNQNYGPEMWQLFVLGTTFAVLTFLLKAPLGLLSGTLSWWIKARPAVLNYINKTSGVILILLGIKLALSQKQ